jgi:hypothetical protein
MKRGFFGLAALSALALVVISTGAAAVTTGSWAQYPSGATEYQAAVQQPIDSANTSNWSAKSKGAIPVMFKLSSRVGPAAFESIGSDGYEGFTATGNFANDFAFMSFTPDPGITFNDITTLKTDYTFTQGDCHGGSLRWSVRTSPTQSVFIYYGAYPQFGNGGVNGCTATSNAGVNQSGVNMINQPDLRYDTSQYSGGTFYDSYAHAQQLVGTTLLTRVSLVIDSGWQDMPNGDQKLNVSNTTVNDNVYQFVTNAGGVFTSTCNLPQATLKVTRIDPQPDGDVNETPVQQSFDNGNVFRIVDCKYQYNLAIPSLPGAGTYKVEIQINGNTVGTAQFDVK